MASCDIGKPEAVAWVHQEFKKGETCLDVGACDGKWSKLLGDYLTMDAVEIYKPNIVKHCLKDKYQNFQLDWALLRSDHLWGCFRAHDCGRSSDSPARSLDKMP